MVAAIVQYNLGIVKILDNAVYLATCIIHTKNVHAI